MSHLWFHLFPVLSSLALHPTSSPAHNSLTSQHSFAVLHPDPALVLPLRKSDNLRTSQRWSLTTQSLQQTSSLIFMKTLQVSLPIHGLQQVQQKTEFFEILAAALANLHWVCMNYLSFKISETWSNLSWQGITTFSLSTYFFGLCSAEQQWKLLELHFWSQHFC